jgi:hypothetical protein
VRCNMCLFLHREQSELPHRLCTCMMSPQLREAASRGFSGLQRAQ